MEPATRQIPPVIVSIAREVKVNRIKSFNLNNELSVFAEIEEMFADQNDGMFIYTYSDKFPSDSYLDSAPSPTEELEFKSLSDLDKKAVNIEFPYIISVKTEKERSIVISGPRFFICHIINNGKIEIYAFKINYKIKGGYVVLELTEGQTN